MINNRTGPTSSKIDMKKLAQMLKIGVPKTKIAREFNISRATLYRVLEEAE